MAESLVNLTKFRLRVSPERETVSGPIDVALISKGDGFVWLKRKHYFQAESTHVLFQSTAGETKCPNQNPKLIPNVFILT